MRKEIKKPKERERDLIPSYLNVGRLSIKLSSIIQRPLSSKSKHIKQVDVDGSQNTILGVPSKINLDF